MSGFHEIQLPPEFSEGALFGPGFATRIIELDSGAEHRVQRYPAGGRRRFNVSKGITTLEKLLTLRDFYIGRDGALFGFRVKDWSDYASTASGTLHRNADVPVDFDDQVIGTGDGTQTTFQLVKTYTSGPSVRTRAIRKPVTGTTKVGIDGVEQTSGFTVDTTTGVVTFSVAPGNALDVTAGYQFDVPCRFGEDADQAFQIALGPALDMGNLPGIELVEEVDPTPVSQTYDFGGAFPHGVITGDVTLSELLGKVQTFAPAVARNVITPAATTAFPAGGPYWVIFNVGSANLTVKNELGATLVTLTPGQQTQIYLIVDTVGTKSWVTLS